MAGRATQKSWICVLAEPSVGLGVDSPWSKERLGEFHPGLLAYDVGGLVFRLASGRTQFEKIKILVVVDA
jgi:hypothetical protein